MTLPFPPRNTTVWLVDDSPTDAERARRVLAAEHHVEVMYDGSTALERLTAGPAPDLLIVDWVMPGVSGLDVCRYLRTPERAAESLPILLLTAKRTAGPLSEAMAAGANDFISKPYEAEELLARVRSLLRTKHLFDRATKAEEAIRHLLANAPDAMLAVDAQGAIVFANDEALRMLGGDRDRVLGSSLPELVPGMDLRTISVGPGDPLLPLPDVQANGRIYSPSVRVLPTDDASHTTVVLRDVTARRQAEMRRLDFYSIIAHDLRTPLSAVLLRLEMAFRGKHGVLPVTMLNDLRKMESNIQSLVAMINDFLELARLEGVGYKIERQPVDLAGMVSATMEDFRPLLETNGLKWAMQGLRANAEVLGDRQRLTQALSNFIGNAVKFTPRGGTITTTVVASEVDVEVAVEDTGPGIAAEELGSLFERYTRVHGPVAGTGLGLLIVRELIEAHGGTVGVESQPGRGSRFWFRVPRVPQGTHTATSSNNRPAPQSSLAP